jgi:D-threo-aldose 1-dehydrogenase
MTARLALGSAQFGLAYGVSNTRGRTSDEEIAAILAAAAAAGVDLIDTAHAYGEAETALGATLPSPCPFRVVTKTARLLGGLDALEQAARASLSHLWLPSAYGLLVHAAADLQGSEGPALWAGLERLRGEGLYEKIGFSAYAEDDILGLARRFRPDIVQLPASLLDQRLVQAGVLAELADLGVEVHLRSVFLQGLLFLPPERLPDRLAGAAGRLGRVRSRLREAGVSPLAAALRFALDAPGAARVVVGVTSVSELEEILSASAAPTPDLPWAALAIDDPVALDPRRWAA